MRLVQVAGEAKVRELGQRPRREVFSPGRVAGEQDVVGLDVAVQDAAFVDGDEGVTDIGGDRQGESFGQHAALVDEAAQGWAGDVFDREVVLAVVLVDLDQAGDVGVADLGEEAGLLEESLEHFRLTGELRQERLDGDDTAIRVVLGAVDLAHAAGAELLEDAEAAETLAHGPPERGRGVLAFDGDTRAGEVVLAGEQVRDLLEPGHDLRDRQALERGAAQHVGEQAEQGDGEISRDVFGLVADLAAQHPTQQAREVRHVVRRRPARRVGQQPRVGVLRPWSEIDLDARRGALAHGVRRQVAVGQPQAVRRLQQTREFERDGHGLDGGQRQASRECPAERSALAPRQDQRGRVFEPEFDDAPGGGMLEELGQPEPALLAGPFHRVVGGRERPHFDRRAVAELGAVGDHFRPGGQRRDQGPGGGVHARRLGSASPIVGEVSLYPTQRGRHGVRGCTSGFLA